jgi:hypothetical protein
MGRWVSSILPSLSTIYSVNSNLHRLSHFILYGFHVPFYCFQSIFRFPQFLFEAAPFEDKIQKIRVMNPIRYAIQLIPLRLIIEDLMIILEQSNFMHTKLPEFTGRAITVNKHLPILN